MPTGESSPSSSRGKQERERNGDSRKIGVGDGRGYGMAWGETKKIMGGGSLVNFGNWELFICLPHFHLSFYVFLFCFVCFFVCE